MKTIMRSYKFKLNPTQEQIVLLEKHFGCVRFIYNWGLNQRINQYQENKTSDNYCAQSKAMTELKKELEWLREVNSQSLQHSLKSLEASYNNFFAGRAKFPRFKSKKSKNSFTVPQKARIENDKIYIPKFREGIRCIAHREINGLVKRMTISKTNTGKYFVSILVEEEYHPKPKTGKQCGIDLGLKDFVITSDGQKYKNHRYTKKYERRLAKAQQHLSRKQKGSNSYESQRRKVAKIHEKISNCRHDNLHKVSHELITNYDVICLEDLNIKGMVKNHKLSKHIADASWGTFVQYLQYKADWNDKEIIKIGRFYPSSKVCNVCGYVNQDLDLSVREWTCPNGHKLDRDINAAKNILKEGLRISYGTCDNTGGAEIRPAMAQAMKPEAPCFSEE